MYVKYSVYYIMFDKRKDLCPVSTFFDYFHENTNSRNTRDVLIPKKLNVLLVIKIRKDSETNVTSQATASS